MSGNPNIVKDFRTSDVDKLLTEIADESTSSDKIKSILQSFLIFSSESKDTSSAMLDGRAVEVLAEFFNTERGKSFRSQITGIFVLLSSVKQENDDKNLSEIAISALSNLVPESDLGIFLQCISGIRVIAATPSQLPEEDSASSPSSSSSSSSSSSKPDSCVCPATVFLSVSSAAVLLEKATALLTSLSVKDRAKQDVLDMLLELVNAGVMNEAAEFVVWRQVQGQGEGGGGGERGNKKGNKSNGGEVVKAVPAIRFMTAFAAFAEAVKGLSKKRSFLGYGAERMYNSIQEKTFFPTFVSLALKDKPTPPQNIDLPMKFIPNSAENAVTDSGTKLYWNTTSGWFTHFVDLEMNEGLYKVSVEYNGTNYVGGGEGFGLSDKEHLGLLKTNYIHHSQTSGTCAIEFNNIYCANTQAIASTFFSQNGKVTLGLELDADTHTLYFFVNDKQIPHCVVNVPRAVYFGVTGYAQGFSCELKSLQKLASPTIDLSLQCAQYNWK